MSAKEECIDVENIEHIINEKSTEKRRKLFSRVFEKFNKKDHVLMRTQEAMLTELLKPVKYMPIVSIQELSETSQFSVEEIKRLYRAFKQLSPVGILNEETVKDIFELIYPIGDSTKYAKLVFLALDKEGHKKIYFGNFIEYLSTMCSDSFDNKIHWAFRFYDVNGDGVISRDEMMKVW